MDIKDSYLHGTVGVVKSISVAADKLSYKLADVAGTTKTVTMPTATQSANGLLSSTDKKKLDSITGPSQSIPYIVGPDTDTTKGTWTGSYSGITAYTDGLTIIYVPKVAGASTTTLNINGLGAKTCHYTGSSNLTTHYAVGTPILLTYVGGYWKRADYDSWTPYVAAYCSTAAATAAKTASCSSYVLTSKTYIHMLITTANTAQSALTMNINSKGAKPIYINGTASSASNYTLPAGTYIVYYDGTNFYFRTDGILPGTIEKATNATSASKVANNLVIKLKSGSTEGTDLYTYNGSAAKTLDIKQGSNVTLTAAANSLTIAASDTKVTQTNTTTSASYRVLFSGNNNDTTETTTARKSSNLLFNPSTGNLTATSLNLNGDIVINDGTNNNRYIKWQYANTDNYGWRIGYLGQQGGDNNDLTFDSHRKKAGWASALYFKHTTLDAHFAGIVIAPTFQGNLDGTYVNKLTNYTIANTIGSIAATDSLNTALGKLEFKTDFIYNDLFGTDNDDVINKWHEIVDFIDSVKEGTDITDEFVTRKTDQTITGAKTFSTVVNITGNNSYREGIRIHHYSGLSSLWFGAVNNSGYDPGMWGISVDTNGMRFRGTDSTTGTSASDYVNIIHGGNVGIGTSSPTAKLHINEGNVLIRKNTQAPLCKLEKGNIGVSLQIDSYKGLYDHNASKWIIGSTADGAVTLLNCGSVGIGTANPTQKLHVTGNILATKFITSGGTSSQFVKGDGSLDSNKYLINTHDTHTSAYYRTTTVNGTNYAFWSHASSAAFTIYAPTTAGTKGQVLTSNGSGAPVWSNSVGTANNGVFYIEGTGTTAGTWLGSHTGIASYYKGLTISYKIPVAGAATTTLNINSLGAITCYINTSKLTAHYGVGSVAILVYDGTYFRAADYWDGNSYAYVRQYTTDSTNSEYPLLFRYNTAAPTSNGYVTEYTRYDSGITINPSTNTITATKFKGTATQIDCTATTDNVTRPIVLTNTSSKLYYTTKATINYSTGNITAPTFTGNLTGTADSAIMLKTTSIKTETEINQSGVRAYTGGGSSWTGAITSMQYAAILTFGNPNRGFQMWVRRGTESIVYRNGLEDSSNWNTPRTILDSANYTSYLGYIGTTAVQDSSAAQALTGITRISNKSNAILYLGNSDNSSWVYTQDICSHSGYARWNIKINGNATFKALTATTGNFSGQITSTVAEGTSPFVITSTKVNTNLNADMLDDYHVTSLVRKSVMANNSSFNANDMTTDLVIYTSKGDIGSNTSVWDNFGASKPAGGFSLFHIKEGGYDRQLLGVYNDRHLYTRSQYYSSGAVWSDWSTLALTSDIPTALKNPNAIKFKNTSGTVISYDGSAVVDLTGGIYSAKQLTQVLFTSGQDLNTIKTEQVYVNTQTSICTSLVNGPTGRSNGEVRLESVTCGSGTYGFQTLYTRANSNYEIWYRTWNSDTFTSWVKNIHSGNYTDYTVKKDGTGATGTWGISITGSASTAAKLSSTTVVSAKAFSLSNSSWTDTSYTFASLASGTYAVQVTSGSNLVASGLMSVYKNLADTAGDEIPLHVYSTAGWRPYLRTYNNKLQISSNDASATSRTVTIKIAQIL